MRAGIDFSIIPISWKDCTGYSNSFPSEHIETYVQFPAAGFDSRKAESFSSPRLIEPLFYEARHFADRALYQLIVGKWMICNDRPTWGLIAYYYSAFFAAQSAIRLAGTFFVKVTYDSETQSPPTHRLDAVNPTTGLYQIRRTGGSGGEHQRVWNCFYEHFGHISKRPDWARFRPITDFEDLELRLSEMHRRHLLNYVPGHGYHEVRSDKDAAEWCKKLSADLPADLSKHVDDEDCQLEVRALLRLELCLQMFHRIAGEGGVYGIHHPGITNVRRGWLNRYGCPRPLADRILAALSQQ